MISSPDSLFGPVMRRMKGGKFLPCLKQLDGKDRSFTKEEIRQSMFQFINLGTVKSFMKKDER